MQTQKAWVLIHVKFIALSHFSNRKCLASSTRLFLQRNAGFMRTLSRASLLCLAMLSACGGGGPKTASLSGNWQIQLQSETSSETQSGFLLQSGRTITGGLQLSGQTISGVAECAGVGSVQGQSSGSNVAIAVSQAGQTANLTGTSGADLATMNGNYSILASGCGQTETGKWTATQVKPLTGNFQFAFTSGASAKSFHYTGTITQGPNLGESTATLSGSMTSSDAPCLTSASLAGVVSGTSVILNFISTEGNSLGKYQGTMTADAKSITGFYRFSNPAIGSCDDIGGATITAQP